MTVTSYPVAALPVTHPRGQGGSFLIKNAGIPKYVTEVEVTEHGGRFAVEYIVAVVSVATGERMEVRQSVALSINNMQDGQALLLA